jgi:type IV secretory pathway VirB9-like protein
MQRDPRVLKEGMQKNIRFVGENQQNAGPILQLDRKREWRPTYQEMHLSFLAKKSAFFPEIDLVQFVCEFVNINPNNLQREWDRNFERINKQIKGFSIIF